MDFYPRYLYNKKCQTKQGKVSMTSTKRVTINGKTWTVAEAVPIEEHFSNSPRLLARATASGILRVLYVKRPNGRKKYPMYQNARGHVWSII